MNILPINSTKKIYDLEERTSFFGEKIIDYVKSIKKNEVVSIFIRQLVRAGTSIGANYAEANEAVSKRDFLNKISICNKEAKETRYWLRMIAVVLDRDDIKNNHLLKEVRELNLIFSTIIKNSRKSKICNVNFENQRD